MSDGPEYPPYPPTQPDYQPYVPPSTGMATAALICGILGMCIPIVGIVGIVLGAVQVSRVGRSPTMYGGRGMAIAGICTGCVGLLFNLAMILAILLPSMTRARELSNRLVCASNVKGFGTSLKIYANDYEGEYPPDAQILIDLGDITPKQLICLSSGHTVADPIDASYIYIPGQNENSDPRNVLMYEREDNHAGEGANVLFGDGHVTFIRSYSEIERLVEETKERMRQEKAAER